MRHPLGRLGLLHPFPSILNAIVVGVLAWLAGAPASVVAALAAAMLGFQVSIGALNDLVDAPDDARSKPGKPIPSGQVSPGMARATVVVGAGTGAACAAWVSGPALLLGLTGYACGVAYDVWLKRRGLGAVAFALALPILLLFAWTGATGDLPPGWPTLLPVAALAGPALHLANTLTDLDHDRASGMDGLAIRVGRRRALLVLTVLVATVHGLAWWTLRSLPDASAASVGLAAAASSTASWGLLLSARADDRATAWGWTLQAISMAALTLAWVASAA